MNKNRVNELMASMKSFSKDKYQKSELLPEMFNLQCEIVGLTFNDDHAATAELKIWDVERHLEQLNKDCGGVAEKELRKFRDQSREFSNLIRAEVSGNRGETKTLRALEGIQSQNVILRNVELSEGGRRTELDFVVITPAAITIVEVKNTAKNIFIDENGDYYRNSEYQRLDCNIAEKMRTKEELLDSALTKGGIKDYVIKSVVVFTDNRIEVHNKYQHIQTCFVSQLASIIDGFGMASISAPVDMRSAETAIQSVAFKESYPFEFDVAQYKENFATLMAVLEDASSVEDETLEEKFVKLDTTEQKTRKEVQEKKSFWNRYGTYLGGVAAAALFAVTTATIMTVVKEVA